MDPTVAAADEPGTPDSDPADSPRASSARTRYAGIAVLVVALVAVGFWLTRPANVTEVTPTSTGVSTPLQATAPASSQPSVGAGSGTAAPPTGAVSPSSGTRPSSGPTLPAAVAELDTAYGRPEVSSAKGTGDGSLPIPAGTRAGLLALTSTGSGAVTVSLVRPGKPAEVLLTSGGNRTETTGFGLITAAPDGSTLAVTATGSLTWTMSLSPLSSAPALSDTQDGSGNQAFLVEGPVALTIRHSAPGSIAVMLTTAAGSDGLFSDSGPVDQTVRIDAGVGVLTIYSADSWTVVQKRIQ